MGKFLLVVIYFYVRHDDDSVGLNFLSARFVSGIQSHVHFYASYLSHCDFLNNIYDKDVKYQEFQECNLLKRDETRYYPFF